MKRILGIAMMLGLLGAVTLIAGCSKQNAPQAKEETPTEKVGSASKEETPTGKVEAATKKIDKIGEPASKHVADFSDNSNIFTITLKRGLKEIDLEMVLVPAGKFKMGYTKKELADLKDSIVKYFKKGIEKGFKKAEGGEFDFANRIMSMQGEQHEVTLTKPFYMGKYEVTQEQYEAVMGSNPSRSAKGSKLPVTDVSWEDCQDFIKKLNAKTNSSYRLPSESEWEYACRAGTTTAYSFGDSITKSDANYYDYDNETGERDGKLVAVGSYSQSAFGLYDMHGNVYEWCEDWHGDYPFAVTDPKGPAEGKNRVIRGGAYADYVPLNRSSDRNRQEPTYRKFNIGFRLAKDK